MSDSTPKIWLPCSWLIELTIREPAAASAADDVDALRQVGARRVVARVKIISVRPICTRSPLLSACRSIRWLLTNVPLELPRSTSS